MISSVIRGDARGEGVLGKSSDSECNRRGCKEVGAIGQSNDSECDGRDLREGVRDLTKY